MQCPIAPGSNFTYRFRADHVGSSWYHSHYSAQLSSGLVGPIVFYGPRSEPFDIDLGPVLISDCEFRSTFLDFDLLMNK